MRKGLLTTKKYTDGFSVVEVILAASLFVMIVTTFIGSYLYGQEANYLSGSRARATLIAEEGIEVVRNIRDNDFNNLDNGTSGLELSSNIWNLSGSSDDIDIFNREIEISGSGDIKEVKSTVTWQQTEQRIGIVTLTTNLTNWAKIVQQNIGSLILNTSNIISGAGGKEIQGIEIQNVSSNDIIITSINISWDSAINITEVNAGGRIWQDRKGVTSGTELDITDQLIPLGTLLSFDKLRFDGSVINTTFSITVTLGDGTVESLESFAL